MRKIETKLDEKTELITVRVPDFLIWNKKYETGITFDNRKTWKIIASYDTKEEAEKGHNLLKNKSIKELKTRGDIYEE